MNLPERVDHILAELAQRYELREDFLNKLRPMLRTILSDEVPDEHRTQLLEMVAETCERDLRMRKGSAQLKTTLEGLVGTIRELSVKLRALAEKRHPGGDEQRPRGAA